MIKNKHKKKNKFSPMFLVIGIILGLYVVSFLAPLFWALMTSFKDPTIDFLVDKLGFPPHITFDNYNTVFTKFTVPVSTGTGNRNVYFPEMLLNSILFAVGNAVIQTVTTFVVAYAAARFPFKIGKVLYVIVIVGMILPLVGSQPSALSVSRQLGLYDSILGMYVHKFTFLGMYFLVFHATLSAFPKDYDEAAQIDGASNFGVMVRIMFPLSITTFSTVLLLNFIAQWNDYSTPMLFMPDVPTLAYGLRVFDSSSDNMITNVPTRIAACMTVAIPTLTLFIIFHDRLLNNVSIGGVKE